MQVFTGRPTCWVHKRTLLARPYFTSCAHHVLFVFKRWKVVGNMSFGVLLPGFFSKQYITFLRSFRWVFFSTCTFMYTPIYVYTCVCVCVCIYVFVCHRHSIFSFWLSCYFSSFFLNILLIFPECNLFSAPLFICL